MNRNNILGLVLIAGIFIVWSIFLTPSKEEIADKQRQNDSIAMVRKSEADAFALAKSIEQQNAVPNVAETITQNLSLDESKQLDIAKYGAFAGSANKENKSFKIETDLVKIKFSSKAGRIESVELKDYQTFDTLPLILFEGDENLFNILFFSDNKRINTKDLHFEPYWYNARVDGQNNMKVSGSEKLQFGLRLYVDGGNGNYNTEKYIEYLYDITGDDYMLDYTINIKGMQDIIASNTTLLNLEWGTKLLKQEKSVDRWNGPTTYYKYLNDDVDYLSETKDDEEDLKSKVKWISYKQHFFSSTLIAKDNFINAKIKVFTDETELSKNSHYLKSMYSEIGLPYAYTGDQSIPMSFYFGPNKFNILNGYDMDLERQIPLGWSFFLLAWINKYAVIQVFNFLEGFGWNYGIIILVLTVLLKLVLFPIAYKTYKSTAKMRVLKPEIDELNAKFPKKEDAMKKQQATMSLYKKAGVNPMAGCVPMLLQMPILFAMFRFFPSSIELRQQSFLWATDLSSYDSIYSWTAEIPLLSSLYGNHISLFTLLMTVSTIMYTRINNQMMGSNQAMPGMKTMMYFMPIMFLGIFNNYASGLSYYYLLANLITFSQMWLIRKTIDEKKIRLQIDANKKKPAKKSNFQKRLEDAAKKRGYQQPKKKK